ncbi:MAG: hypothetical protein JWO08_2180 [Verrucomicrobiaceae bacterium]|nr:hypothetical protein [Verrucomicrobiaceae bacterium]
MPHRLFHVTETCLALITSLCATAGGHLMLAEAALNEPDELRLLLLPLIGALIISGGLIMLNPAPETRRIVIGRAMIALFCGAIGPQVIALVHPSLGGIIHHPALLLAAGAIIGGVVIVLSKPFAEAFYQRSQRLAEQELDRLEQKFGPNPPQPPSDTP